MRASSNNSYKSKTIPFTNVEIHAQKILSEDDTGYESFSKDGIKSSAGLSSSSSSSNVQVDRLMNLVKNIPSPTDVSTTNETIDDVVNVAKRIEQFSKCIAASTTPVRKPIRTRIRPIPDSTSDSTDSFALSNHLILVAPYAKRVSHRISNLSTTIEIPNFGKNLEFVQNQRFGSSTIVEAKRKPMNQLQIEHPRVETVGPNENMFHLSWLTAFGESIRQLSPNTIAIVFIGLLSCLLISAFVFLIFV